jgi:hypothetical protein
VAQIVAADDELEALNRGRPLLLRRVRGWPGSTAAPSAWAPVLGGVATSASAAASSGMVAAAVAAGVAVSVEELFTVAGIVERKEVRT